MGTLFYEQSPILIEDRALAHLQVVITTKLRRGEAFTLSWRHAEEQPEGRSTIWIHPSIPLRFIFDDTEPETLSRAWLDKLAQSAHSTSGITLVAEPTVDAEGNEEDMVVLADDRTESGSEPG